MHVIHASWCGLDLHNKTVVGCVMITQPDGSVERQTRTFGTIDGRFAEAGGVARWLRCDPRGDESTGVFWRPVYNMLEDERRMLLLVHPQHLRAVAGNKTDMKDAEWIADLLRHGLLQAQFHSSRLRRELRELTRYRKTFAGARRRCESTP